MLSMFAATTNAGGAELLFIVAFILLLIAAIVGYIVVPLHRASWTMGFAGLSCIALGLFFS